MLKYQKKIEKTAKSIDEAKAQALRELGIDEESAIVEVLDEGGKGGFLGLVSKDARVLVTALDENAVVAKSFLSKVFDAMGMDVDIRARSGADALNVEMSGEHMGIVIGKRGDTLDALQYLTSLVVNHESDERVRVVLDTENYRQKRETALLNLAKRLADKVARTGKKHTLEPMNPYERRIIHSSLQSNDKVTTFSIGEDPYRKLVIAPKQQAEKPVLPKIHISNRSAAEYRQHNPNKHKSFDEFLESNEE